LPFMIVFPPGHPLESMRRITWADAMRHPIIALQGQFTDRLILDLHGAISTPVIRPSHEVAFMSTALSMVSAGLGITPCLPYARSLVDLYGMRMRPLCDPEVRRRFFVYTRRHASLSPAAEAFAQLLPEFISELEWRLEDAR